MGVLGQLGLWSLQKDGPGLKVPEFGGLGWEKNVDFLFIKDLETPIDTLLSMALCLNTRPALPRPDHALTYYLLWSLFSHGLLGICCLPHTRLHVVEGGRGLSQGARLYQGQNEREV